jgi:hypothetical protein
MNLVASVEIGGQEVANSKLSAVLLFGVLGGLGAKGSKSQATVIVRTTDGNAAYFTLDELTAVQARAKLAPVLRKARVPFSDEIQTGGAATTGPALDIAGRLRELAALRDDGILTEDEFAAQKARLLDE